MKTQTNDTKTKSKAPRIKSANFKAFKIKTVINAVSVIISIAVFVTGFTALDRLLCFKSDYGIDQTRSLYYQEKNSIDVVFMGTSHVHCGVNTALLWEEYGIAGFDYSAAEQALWQSYHYLIELQKTQQPKIICLDLFAPAVNQDDYQYTWINQNVYGMRFSLNKLNMLKASVESDKVGQYISNFAGYHTRFTELKEEDYEAVFDLPETMKNYKGYTPYTGQNPVELNSFEDVHPALLTEKSEEYLRKIIEECEKKGIRLLLMVVPYELTEDDMHIYNECEEIADEYGVEFINFANEAEALGFDGDTDFNDYSHLNHRGASKFTRLLAGYLNELEELTDHRGEKGYESWDSFAAYINEKVKGSGQEE